MNTATRLPPIAVAAIAYAVIGFTAIQPAHAGIKCDGQFQIVKGQGLVSTPFCEAEYFSSIARKTYGIRVSAKTLRNNINRYIQLCRTIGHDYRLTGICRGHKNPNQGNRWNS